LETGLTLSQDYSYEDTLAYFFTANSTSSLSSNAFSSISLQHLVYTKDPEGRERIYLNGLVSAIGTYEGDFSNWNAHTFKLAMGNSLGFRNSWTGKLFLAAVYNRALSQEEVVQNHLAGFKMAGEDSSPPAAPSKLASEALSAVAAEITWEDQSDDETGFVVERRPADGRFSFVTSIPANTTAFVDAELSPGEAYEYRIKALNNYGESVYSNASSVTALTDANLINVALGKSATQSSTTYKGDAGRAVDGNTDGVYTNNSVTHTAYELNAWWEVDLGDLFYIDHLEVWNRTDLCCKDRMARFYIFISDEPFESQDFQTTMEQQGVTALYQEFFPDPKSTFNVARKGRYIRLQLSDSQNICMAEMVVMGQK
jgi:hypothetical protein